MLITFSGMDGSGKTATNALLREQLECLGKNVELIKPRYYANDVLKKLCEKKYGDEYTYYPKLNSSLYISALLVDWLELLSCIKNNDKKIYICDRYIYDVYAQAIHFNAECSIVEDCTSFFYIPDYSFYLKVEPRVAYSRLINRTEPQINRLESLDNLKILDNAYRTVMKSLKWEPYIIDANNEIHKNVEEIKNIIVRGNNG